MSLKFLAAALINEIPPISIFSIISASFAPEATVFSKGYKSTITKSICGILNSFAHLKDSGITEKEENII